MTLKLSKHYVTAAVISEIKSSTNHEEEDKYIQKQKEQSDSSSVSSSVINYYINVGDKPWSNYSKGWIDWYVS